jgi:predicted Zn-dependent protease
MLWRRGRTVPSVVVLVREPVVHSGEAQPAGREAAFVVREAVVRALTELEGVETVGPDDASPTQGITGAAQAARAAGATEAVVPSLECATSSCRVSLRRQDAASGRVVASSQAFQVSTDPDDALAVAGAVTLRVREAFAEHRLRDRSGALEVTPADFEKYLAFRRRTAAGDVLSAADVDALETSARSSPGLPEARLLAAGSARSLGDRTRTLALLDGASTAERSDPRFLTERFQLELEKGRAADAEQALAALEARVPGDVRAVRGRARLLVRQGRSAEAAEVYRQLLRQRPSWRTLWSVANIEIDLGDAARAREHLTSLLELSPGNPSGRAKLAQLEWTLGDPMEAARIYRELIDEKETPINVANLGWSLLLAGDFKGAAEACARAVALKPSDLQSRMLLGTAREALGDRAAGQADYRAVLDALAAAERDGPLDAPQRLLTAEALARLGQPVPAVEITMQVQGEGESSPDQVFQTALIFALAGDSTHAIVQARRARERHAPTWFRIPGFESVRDDPAFRELLAPGR